MKKENTKTTSKGVAEKSSKMGYTVLKNKLQQLKNNREKSWINFFIGVAFFSILAGLIVFIVFLIKLNHYYSIAANSIDIEKTGQVGDFVGGIVGSIWSLTGVLLFYAALRVQSKELQENRINFQLSRLTDIVYRELEIFNKHMDNFQLNDKELDNKGQQIKYKGGEATIFLARRIEAFKQVYKKVEEKEDLDVKNQFMANNYELIELNKIELLNIYEELANHSDTIRAVLIKEGIKPIDLNELKGIFFRNVGREFLNSSDYLLEFIDWYIEFKKVNDKSYEEFGSIETMIKRKIKSIKKFRNKHYDKETIDQYITRREMYNIHYF